MIETHELYAAEAAETSIQNAIQYAVAACRDVLSSGPDETVAYELRQLESLEDAVSRHWPLPQHTKDRMDLGPFAAKNIADWNSSLASVLMKLDYALRHDGEGLASVFPEPALTPGISEHAPYAPPELPEEAPESTSESFDQALAAYERANSRRVLSDDGTRSNQIAGTVVGLTADAVLIDIGYKTEGTLPLVLFTDRGEAPVIGDKLLVTSKGRNEEGYYDLSLHKAAQPRDISSLEAAFAAGSTISGTVTAIVKGGLTVDVGVRAFLPGSRSGARDAAELEKLVGTEILCRIIKLEADVDEVDVVVDRRVVLEEESKINQARRYAEISEGAVVSGTVRSLTDYGAFVDLGGLDGLLHISDISWTRVASPSDVLTLGQQIDVKILKIDPATKRIALGLKQLLPHPWDSVPDTYKVGDRIRGPVTRLTDFGAFIELTPGVEGMIHVSEMSWARKVRKPEDMLKLGDVVEAMVLGIDTAAQRISLGLKQTLGDPWDDAAAKFPAGSTVTGPVASLTKFGAFITLADGIEGIVHVSELLSPHGPDRRVERPQDVLRTGQVVQAKVLEVDPARRQIKLSMKQLVPTGLDEYLAEHRPGDTVTARILSIDGKTARVELGEGIYAACQLPSAAAPAVETPKPAGTLDLSAFSTMLNAKWKGGPSAPRAAAELPQPGQIRNFRIASLDPAAKQIAVELLA
jgi:small subunit ribosomal protein S1